MISGRGILRSLLFLLVLACAAAWSAPSPAPTPGAVNGRLELGAVPSQPVPLQGEWGFAWHRFIDPAWERLPTTAVGNVPSSWNELSADGKPAGENGWGSYALLVNCPQGQSAAIEAAGQRTASRLFVNGTLVAQHGEPGPTPDQSRAAVHNRVPITHEFACPLRLTLHVSNFDHRGGGFVRPLKLGSEAGLALHRESQVIQASALLSAYLIAGLVSLIFFAARRRERIPLVFGLFCVAMAIYTDMSGERLFLRLLPPQVSWVTYMRVEYVSWVAAMALFFMTLRGLFPADLHLRVVQLTVAVLGVAGLSTFVLPPAVYSYLAVPGLVIGVAVSVYLTAAMLRAHRRMAGDATVLLGGVLAILAAMALDLLFIESLGADRKFIPIGFALFLLSPAVVIARRLSRALNAEERGRTLEENARLREDVERISRHDLKTPLSSILGATRLLRDDDKLTGEQRELVGVLQRASMRMLEMVNLSLGLFRMETGSYDFRPQAVELRDLVDHVLVDLHSYADAAGVTLHLQGSERAPLYVRGEELLCYSIVANLVKNAIEATARGQQVTLRLHRRDPVMLAIHNPREVPRSIAERFFDKYATAGKSGGTGLGTYSARLMARAQQGELQLQTGAGHGTTLTLTLRPLNEDASQPAPLAAMERPASAWLATLPPRDVLLVDDDEYLRLVTRRFLPSPPFHVETAANGQAAIDSMARRWPDYLLVDMEMPVKNGLETVRWLRAHEAAHQLPRCRVVMMSGNDDALASQKALQAGVDRFLPKPVSRELLLATLQELEPGLGFAPAPTATTPRAMPGVAQTTGDGVVIVDAEWADVFPDFVRLQRDTVEAMADALAAGDREDLQFLAHRAYGGLGSMGLHWAAGQSRALEQEAPDAPIESLQGRIVALREHLGTLRIESA
ncbi:MAG: hybrid sensor histidine kinase/response regulator [Ramlibacter sp.]|nr:hybrid sensor histidine kinase/response regulator [Ramlibacter sp.]